MNTYQLSVLLQLITAKFEFLESFFNQHAASDGNLADVIKQKVAKHHKARGLAVIVTNDYIGTELADLHKTDDDGREMDSVFNELKFVTHWAKNVTTTQHQQIIDGIIKSDHPDSNGYYKCIAYIFSGHGDENGSLYLQDGGEVNLVKDVIEKLSEPKLAHIPKLFFIDACRGEIEVTLDGAGTVAYESKYNVSVGPSTPRFRHRSALRKLFRISTSLFRRKGHSEAKPERFQEILALLKGNFLIAYATIETRVSYENKEMAGSAWMQILAGELREDGISVQDATAIVRRKLVERYRTEEKPRLQQPETVDRLNGGPLYLRDYVSLMRLCTLIKWCTCLSLTAFCY